jgi:hypothetical protein
MCLYASIQRGQTSVLSEVLLKDRRIAGIRPVLDGSLLRGAAQDDWFQGAGDCTLFELPNDANAAS